jgi:hypothetical protein
MTREQTRVDLEVRGGFGSRRMLRTMAYWIAVALWLVPGAASAQPSVSEPWTVEAVVSGSANSLAPGDPFLIFDLTGTGRLRDGLDIIVRPYAHRLTGGDWTAEMYQLQLRYVVPTRIPLRLDAGIIASPLGLNTLELIAAKNPTIGAPFFYFAPLPRFDAHNDGVQLISGGYPLGAIVSTSGSRWDVRAGVTDQSPTRRRNVLESDRPDAALQIVAGGGYTPVVGLRVGTSVARGAYRKSSTTGPSSAAVAGTNATMFTIEGEYAVGYSRLTVEWIRDAFETAGRPAIARGFSLVANRTLSPRWFVAARANRVSSPVFTAVLDSERRAATSGEATLGYRLNRDVTLRAAYQASRWFGVTPWKRTFAVSAVWARRWR